MRCLVFTRRFSVLSVAATIGVSAAMFAGNVHATLLWYDGFSLTDDGGDYVVGSDLPGTSGGSGSFFAGNWVAGDADPISWSVVTSDGLSRPGLTLPTEGGASTNAVDYFCCTFGRTSRLFANPWGGFGDPDGTFYMGFLVDFGTGPNDDPQHRTIEMHDGGFDDGANLNLELGIRGFTGDKTDGNDRA